MIIATAGHVDHGKTSLVKALTGIDADRLPEEKRRGMTIDLGFAYMQAERPAGADTTAHAATAPALDLPALGLPALGLPALDLPLDLPALGFIDVPGHERFVHNMLAGVAGIDCALLVIAADDGPMPQTREHLAILDLLGVRVGAVALTKIDAVEAARVDQVAREITALLAPTALASSPVFPLSSITGAGLPALRAYLHRLHNLHANRAAHNSGRFRMTVDRAFTVAGAGLVVTGTVIAGAVGVGDEVHALLAGARARVRGLHAHNHAAQRAAAGQRCALNLAGSGVAHTSIARGDWIVADGAAPPASRIDFTLRVLASETRPFQHWTPVHAHIGAADVTGRVALLDTSALAPGASGLAQLVLDRPLGACHGDAVILRDQSAQRTVGGGKVIDVFAPPRGRARPARLAYLKAMACADHAGALAAALAVSPTGLDLANFAACRNLAPATLDALTLHSGMQRVTPGTGFLPAHWHSARQAALAAVTAWHQRHPALPGIPEDRLLDGTGLKLVSGLKAALKAALGAALVASGDLVRVGAGLKLPGHSAGLQGADQALWERIRVILEAEGARPPTVAELALSLKAPARDVKALLVRAAQQHLAWRVSEERFALPATVQSWAAHASALAGAERQQRFKATEYRDRAGVGRNLSIEILEFFDRVKFTRRIGDVRLLQHTASEVFGAALRK